MVYEPQYGLDILKRHFEDVTYRDYEEVNKKFPTEHNGIMLIFYDGYFSGHINYLPDSLHFKLETEYDKFISLKIKKTELNNAHFEYFSDVIRKLQSNKKEIDYLCKNFKVELPIDYIRDEKLKQLI